LGAIKFTAGVPMFAHEPPRGVVQNGQPLRVKPGALR
jgi:hypothetical protein